MAVTVLLSRRPRRLAGATDLASADDAPVATGPVDGDAGVDGLRPPAGATQRSYTLKHTTRRVRAMVTDLHHRARRARPGCAGRAVAADTLTLNEIGLVSLRATAPAVRRRLPPQPGRRGASC